MNPSFLWKLYFVSLLAHRMQYPKRYKEFSFEFPIPLGFDVFAIQPNFVARGIASRLCMVVVTSLLKLLCMLKVLSADSHQLSELGR